MWSPLSGGKVTSMQALGAMTDKVLYLQDEDGFVVIRGEDIQAVEVMNASVLVMEEASDKELIHAMLARGSSVSDVATEFLNELKSIIDSSNADISHE